MLQPALAQLYRFPTERRMSAVDAPERVRRIMEQTLRLEAENEVQALEYRERAMKFFWGVMREPDLQPIA